jgi:uncharacterized protein YuzE
MKLSYDPVHNIAYLRVRESEAQVETIRVSEDLNIDLAPDGTVYGIEFLDANAQLAAGDGGRLVIEAGSRRAEVQLTAAE